MSIWHAFSLLEVRQHVIRGSILLCVLYVHTIPVRIVGLLVPIGCNNWTELGEELQNYRRWVVPFQPLHVDGVVGTFRWDYEVFHHVHS